MYVQRKYDTKEDTDQQKTKTGEARATDFLRAVIVLWKAKPPLFGRLQHLIPPGTINPRAEDAASLSQSLP